MLGLEDNMLMPLLQDFSLIQNMGSAKSMSFV